MVYKMLTDMRFATWVSVDGFVYVVTLALEGGLAIVQWHEVGRNVARERIAHHEELVCALAATRDEVTAVGRAALIGGLLDVETGGAGLDPDELPVEIKLIVEAFASVKGSVLQWALRYGRASQCDE